MYSYNVLFTKEAWTIIIGIKENITEKYKGPARQK
jgi:hypothetical protein